MQKPLQPAELQLKNIWPYAKFLLEDLTLAYPITRTSRNPPWVHQISNRIIGQKPLEGIQQWKSRELVRNLPAKDRLIGSPAQCGLTHRLMRPRQRGWWAQVSPSSLAPGQHGTRTRWVRR